MKQLVILIIVLISLASALAITGTNDAANLNITKGKSTIISINTDANSLYLRGAAQSIIGLANVTETTVARFGILASNAIPEIPILITPKNNSFLNYNGIFFEWSAEDQNNDSLSSLFELFNDSLFTQVYERRSGLNQTTYNITIPEEITLYWRTRVNDGSDNSSFSEINQFTIDTTPPTNFTLLSPLNTSSSTDTTPALSWSPSTETNLQNYTIELCAGTDCENITELGTTTENSFSNWTTATALDEAITYYWRVKVADKANNQNISDLFTYSVEASITETITISTGSGGETTGSTGTHLFSLSIISPPDITLVKDGTITIPLNIKNPARLVTLRGITLDIVSDSTDIIPTLGRTSIPQLVPGEETIVPLTLTAVGQPGAYGMTITARVRSPDFIDKVRVLANLIEAGAASVTASSKQLSFASDLINGNPECLDLKEYVDQAREALESGDTDRANSILEAIISNCQQIISTEKSSLTTTITGSAFEIAYLLEENQTTLIIAGETLAFILVIVIVVKVIRRKKKTTTSKY